MSSFARNAFDPMDFTPMALDKIPNINRKTTPAFELVLPVLFLSRIQHIAKISEGMAKMPAYVVDYLKDIPTNWDDSKFIVGFLGKYILMARRSGNIWHVVGINGENAPKEVEVDLSFVKNQKGFIIMEDENGFKQESISRNQKLTVKMKPNCGFVIKI